MRGGDKVVYSEYSEMEGVDPLAAKVRKYLLVRHLRASPPYTEKQSKNLSCFAVRKFALRE